MESVTDEDVFSAIFDMISDEEVETSKKPKCNARKPHVKAESLWHSAWGQMIGSSDVLDPNSRNGSKFRLRFRVPYPLYRDFLVPLCSREGKNVFQEHRKSVIPTEIKVLIALRMGPALLLAK